MKSQNSPGPEKGASGPGAAGGSPAYWRPVKPSMNRRAPWHDYSSPSIYMITLLKGESTPLLSEVVRDNAVSPPRYSTRLFPAGRIARDCIYGLPIREPRIAVRNLVVMPDHVHFIIHVKERLERPVNYIIGNLMGRCTSALRSLQGDDGLPPFFTKGFHDRILTGRDQLVKMVNYVKDNPRRLFLRRHFAGYFNSGCELRFADGRQFQIFGNLLLLKDPDKVAVKISSKYSPERLAALRQQWRETARNCGVLISPWISPKEKEVREEALEAGGKVISIVENGFEDRFKPSGRDFDLCTEGRLLLVAFEGYTTRPEKLTRQKALAMNALAEELATAETFSLIKKPPQGNRPSPG